MRLEIFCKNDRYRAVRSLDRVNFYVLDRENGVASWQHVGFATYDRAFGFAAFSVGCKVPYEVSREFRDIMRQADNVDVFDMPTLPDIRMNV